MIAYTNRKLREETLNIRSLELTKVSINLAERIFWILIAISGTAWFFYFMNTQVKIWNENKIIVNKASVDLSEIDYPAITFCSNSANKYGIAERLGNHLDPNVKTEIEFLVWLKKVVVSCYGKSFLNRFTEDVKNAQVGSIPDMCTLRKANEQHCKVSTIQFSPLLLSSSNPLIVLKQALERIYNCKENSQSMKSIFEDILNHLSEDLKFSSWNISKGALKYIQKNFDCFTLAGNIDVEDSPFVDSLLMLLQGNLDWATEKIGTWMTQIKYAMMVTKCSFFNKTDYDTRINEWFTKEGGKVSLLDMFRLFSIKDVSAIDVRSEVSDVIFGVKWVGWIIILHQLSNMNVLLFRIQAYFPS